MTEIDELVSTIKTAEAEIERQKAIVDDASTKLRSIQAKINTALKPKPVFRGANG